MIPVDDPLDPRPEIFHRNERALAGRADRCSDDGAGLFMAAGDRVRIPIHAGVDSLNAAAASAIACFALR